jgi:phosphopantothenoylcysteine synthetase/decarboxylase
LAREGTLDSAMNILVTGGGTIAPIDDVRAITNTSTGRFSSAISEAALRRGATVWHVHTPNALVPLPALVPLDLDAERLRNLKAERQSLLDRLTLVPLAEGTVPEYLEALRSLLVSQPFDAVFLAMAVSDYAPEPIIGKLKSDLDELIIRCKRVPKVIQSVRDWAPDTYLVGFKLTSGASDAELIDRAAEANMANRTDLTVANDLQLYRQGKHTVHLVRPGQPTETLGPGGDIAGSLVDRVFQWVGERPR